MHLCTRVSEEGGDGEAARSGVFAIHSRHFLFFFFDAIIFVIPKKEGEKKS
jgi:hypothetical protein